MSEDIVQDAVAVVGAFFASLDWKTLLTAVFLALMIDWVSDARKSASSWLRRGLRRCRMWLRHMYKFPKEIVRNFKSRPQRLLAKEIEALLRQSTEDLFNVRVFFSNVRMPSFYIEDIEKKPLEGGLYIKAKALLLPVEYFWGAFYRYTEGEPETVHLPTEKYLSYKISRSQTLQFVKELKSRKLHKTLKNGDYIPSPSEFISMVKWEAELNDFYRARIDTPISTPDNSVLVKGIPEQLILSAIDMRLQSEIYPDFKWSEDSNGTLFLAQSSGIYFSIVGGSVSDEGVHAPQMTLLTKSGFVLVREQNGESNAWQLSASDLSRLRSKLEKWRIWKPVNEIEHNGKGIDK